LLSVESNHLFGRWGHNTGVVFNRPTADAEGGADYEEAPPPLGNDPLLNGGAVAFDESTSIALRLQEAGYHTCLAGKWMNSMDLYGEGNVPLGWDEFYAFVDDGFNFFDYTLNSNGVYVHYGDAEADYSTDVTNEPARSCIDNAVAAGKPWFVVWAPYAPHFDVGFYSTTPAPRHVDETFASGYTPPIAPSYDEADLTDKPEWVQDKRETVWEHLASTIDAFRYETADSLEAIDEGVFDLLVKLEQHRAARRTMVVYTSDNGYLWGEHGLGMKSVMYEESVRVDLIIRYPELHRPRRPTVEPYLVGNVDLAPTFAGIDCMPDGGADVCEFDGRSLLPIIDGSVVEWPDSILIEGWQAESTVPNIQIPALFPVQPDRATVRTKSHKLTDYETGTDELYDLVSDPYEMENLIDDPAHDATEAALRSELDALLAE
jgi:arylsulfatase A-like enzyme